MPTSNSRVTLGVISASRTMDASSVASLESQLSARLDAFLAVRRVTLWEGLRKVVISIVDTAMVEVSNFLLDKAMAWLLVTAARKATHSEEAKAFRARCIVSIKTSIRKFLEQSGLFKDGSSAIHFVDSTLSVDNRFKTMLIAARAKAGQHGVCQFVCWIFPRTPQSITLQRSGTQRFPRQRRRSGPCRRFRARCRADDGRKEAPSRTCRASRGCSSRRGRPPSEPELRVRRRCDCQWRCSDVACVDRGESR